MKLAWYCQRIRGATAIALTIKVSTAVSMFYDTEPSIILWLCMSQHVQEVPLYPEIFL